MLHYIKEEKEICYKAFGNAHFQVSLTGLLSLIRRFPKEADKVLRQGDLLEASPRSSLFKEFSSLIKRMRIKEPFLHLMPIQ